MFVCEVDFTVTAGIFFVPEGFIAYAYAGTVLNFLLLTALSLWGDDTLY